MIDIKLWMMYFMKKSIYKFIVTQTEDVNNTYFKFSSNCIFMTTDCVLISIK
jgi:hypothetical protein